MRQAYVLWDDKKPLIAQYDALQARRHVITPPKPEPEPGNIVHNMILAHNAKISIFKKGPQP